MVIVKEPDYLLRFLGSLRDDFEDADVEDLWRHRIFPLIHTDDFSDNWRAVHDSNGIFHVGTDTVARYSVEPQPHHVGLCEVTLGSVLNPSPRTVVYEAIIFAKLLYSMSLNSPGQISRDTVQARDRHFVSHYARRLPVKWRGLIIQNSLHYYGENDHRHLSKPENIRILKLLPSYESHSPIECALEEVEMESQPFEALSYVWGPQTSRKIITLNGRCFPVGKNLEAALRHLRLRDTRRTLWIDAICIDQSNLQERADQVAQMDRIYESASKVIVWVGRESCTSIFVFAAMEIYKLNGGKESPTCVDDFISFLVDARTTCLFCEGSFDSAHQTDRSSRTRLAEIQEHANSCKYAELRKNFGITSTSLDLSLLSILQAFAQLFQRPWWQRVWVLQEAILAKKVVLQCGLRVFDWHLLRTVVFALIQLGRRSIHFGDKQTRAMTYIAFVHFAKSSFPFFFLEPSYSSLRKDSNNISMANLLGLTPNCQATDPRDVLFALVGLLPKDSPERIVFKPDYKTSKSYLFIKAARHFLESTNTLEVITARPSLPSDFELYLGKPTHGAQPLPSWVPDWHFPNEWRHGSICLTRFSFFHTLSLLMRRKDKETLGSSSSENTSSVTTNTLQLYNASQDHASQIPFEFSEMNRVLHTWGIRFDEVEEVGLSWLPKLEHNAIDYFIEPTKTQIRRDGGLKTYFQQWKSIASISSNEPYPLTNQSRRTAFWRTILLDRYRDRSDVGGEIRILRIPPWCGEDNSAQDLQRSAWCHLNMPPTCAEDELQFERYIYNESEDTGTVAEVSLHCTGLRFFRTRNGSFGFGHPNVQEGDIITVLLGASVPLILRPSDKGNVLIGQSYVHGVMDGEIIQKERNEGRGFAKNDFEEFRII